MASPFLFSMSRIAGGGDYILYYVLHDGGSRKYAWRMNWLLIVLSISFRNLDANVSHTHTNINSYLYSCHIQMLQLHQMENQQLLHLRVGLCNLMFIHPAVQQFLPICIWSKVSHAIGVYINLNVNVPLQWHRHRRCLLTRHFSFIKLSFFIIYILRYIHYVRWQ